MAHHQCRRCQSESMRSLRTTHTHRGIVRERLCKDCGFLWESREDAESCFVLGENGKKKRVSLEYYELHYAEIERNMYKIVMQSKKSGFQETIFGDDLI